jgi:hypothetical protein
MHENTLIREDGYINATEIAKRGGRQVKEWKRLQSTSRLLTLLSKKLSTPEDQLLEPGRGRGSQTWVHPTVATSFACWVSEAVKAEVSTWVEEWKEREQNKVRYVKELDSIVPESHCAQEEKEIQERLARELGGKQEVETPAGRIDILTSTCLLEVKLLENWKAGVGQLMVYGQSFPSHSRRLHLFGGSPPPVIYESCHKLGILVTHE